MSPAQPVATRIASLEAGVRHLVADTEAVLVGYPDGRIDKLDLANQRLQRGWATVEGAPAGMSLRPHVPSLCS